MTVKNVVEESYPAFLPLLDLSSLLPWNLEIKAWIPEWHFDVKLERGTAYPKTSANKNKHYFIAKPTEQLHFICTTGGQRVDVYTTLSPLERKVVTVRF